MPHIPYTGPYPRVIGTVAVVMGLVAATLFSHATLHGHSNGVEYRPARPVATPTVSLPTSEPRCTQDSVTVTANHTVFRAAYVSIVGADSSVVLATEFPRRPYNGRFVVHASASQPLPEQFSVVVWPWVMPPIVFGNITSQARCQNVDLNFAVAPSNGPFGGLPLKAWEMADYVTLRVAYRGLGISDAMFVRMLRR